MGFGCPHCNKEIDGVIKQDLMTERLKSQRETLEGKIAEAVTNVEKAYQEKLTAVQSESEKVNGEFQTYKQLTTRANFLRQNGISEDKHSTFFLLYDSSQAGKVNGDSVGFEDWLSSDALSHPVLGSHFPAVNVATSTQSLPTDLSSASVAPSENKPAASLPHLTGAVSSQPDPARRQTPDEVAAYFRSDKYRSLSPEERATEFNRLQDESSF
jgi:hypothetical protein